MADGTTLDDDILACFLAKLDHDPAVAPELRAELRRLVSADALPSAAALAAAIRGKERADGEAAAD